MLQYRYLYFGQRVPNHDSSIATKDPFVPIFVYQHDGMINQTCVETLKHHSIKYLSKHAAK